MTLTTGQAPRGSVPAIDDGSISLDLRIAVSGHRKLTATPALSTVIDQALDRIVDQLRPAIRDHCRLVVVSALADGADRIVADRVLARQVAELVHDGGLGLAADLPPLALAVLCVAQRQFAAP